MQYFNHTLNDYLTALRSNKSFLGQDELKFVMGHLAESMFVLKSKHWCDRFRNGNLRVLVAS